MAQDTSIDIEEQNSDDLMELAEFIRHFNIHYALLLRRYKRFCEINNSPNMDIDVITYLDMLVVQLRAMCIESPRLKKNYTASVLLRKVGEEALADKLEKMLDEPFIQETDFTIRKAIKTLADGFICHYDNFDGADSDTWALAAIIEKQLRSPYDKCNLDYIINTLNCCIGEGLTIKLK